MSEIVEIEALHTVRGETIDTTLTRPAAGPIKGKVLFLHGAGESTKDRCLPLARALSARGWGCLTFSFPGHGKSSGVLQGSTLQGRKQVAQAIAHKLGFLPADRVVAISMGAHTAISLLKDHPDMTQHLVLMVPAIYARDAEDVSFGPAFSEVLRRPDSYLAAEPWDILPTYEGRLAIVQAGADEVIPTAIIDKLHAAATAAARAERLYIADSPHRISNWINDDQSRIEAFRDAIDSFDFARLAKTYI